MKNADVLNLKWNNRSKSKITSTDDCDISINKIKDGYNFIFRNECYKKLANNGAFDRVEFAVFDETTIVFRSTKHGFKLSGLGNRANPSFQYVPSKRNPDEELVEALENMLGNYELKYEPHFKLYYISKEED